MLENSRRHPGNFICNKELHIRSFFLVTKYILAYAYYIYTHTKYILTFVTRKTKMVATKFSSKIKDVLVVSCP